MKYKDFFLREITMNAPEKVTKDEARRIYKLMHYTFDFNEFYTGMNVELEHADVTNGELVATAKIAAAHLKENPKYYTLLKQYVEKK